MANLDDLIRDILAEEPTHSEQENEEPESVTATLNADGNVRLASSDAGLLCATNISDLTFRDNNNRWISIERIIDGVELSTSLTERMDTFVSRDIFRGEISVRDERIRNLENLVAELMGQLQALRQEIVSLNSSTTESYIF